jgi:hypothetical protein
MAPEYMDEKIRKIINQAEEHEKIHSQNIYEGITVNGLSYEFQQMAFFEGCVNVQIPTAFADMQPAMARLKYPSGERPSVIKTNDTGEIAITLNVVSHGVNDENIPMVKDGMKLILKRLNPSYLFLEEGVEAVAGKTLAFFEFKSPALDQPLYNLMFFLELDRRVLLGNVSCPYQDFIPWRPIARQIMQSVRIESNPQVGGKDA